MCARSITFVTGNKKKLNEVLAIVGPEFPFTIVSKSLNLTEIQGTIENVAISKCKEASRILNTAVIVEDTALCFNALEGLPGPFIKWFLDEIKPIGLYKMLSGFNDKSAKAICTIAYHDGQSDLLNIKLFQGIVDGCIVEPKNVPNCFGFDDCFQPNGYTKTFSQMDVTEKNQISHRFLAFKKFREYFLNCVN